MSSALRRGNQSDPFSVCSPTSSARSSHSWRASRVTPDSARELVLAAAHLAPAPPKRPDRWRDSASMRARRSAAWCPLCELHDTVL